MDSLRRINKFETKEYALFGGNQVQILRWTLNTDTNVIRYEVENKQHNFKAVVIEDQLQKIKQNE